MIFYLIYFTFFNCAKSDSLDLPVIDGYSEYDLLSMYEAWKSLYNLTTDYNQYYDYDDTPDERQDYQQHDYAYDYEQDLNTVLKSAKGSHRSLFIQYTL